MPSLAPLLRVVLCAALLFAAAGPAQAQTEGPLAGQIEEVLTAARTDAFWGLHAVDLTTGETLVRRNAEKGFLPASNQKLVTIATALDALGSTHRYQTELRFDGVVEDSVLRGDLVLVGSGDPTFGSAELRGADPLRQWAENLAEMGVRRIEGRLIGDDRVFDGRDYPEGWDVDYITRQAGRYIGASSGGLSYRDNVVMVRLLAGEPGAAPAVTLRPEGVVQIDNRATTSTRRRGSSLQIDRAFDSNQLTLTGSVPRFHRGTVHIPVSDPTAFTLHSFRQRLAAEGIVVRGSIADADTVDAGRSPGELLFVSVSPPLSEIAAVVNKRSSNFYAEQVFRTYAWGGSARGAAQRTESFFRRAGVTDPLLRVADGSGLSRKDLISPRTMTALLARMNSHKARDAFVASLAAGGENNTTLEYRLRRVPVQAKTGSLRSVRALSGYVRRANGHTVAFALFANNYTAPSYRVERAFDAIVERLAAAPGPSS